MKNLHRVSEMSRMIVSRYTHIICSCVLITINICILGGCEESNLRATHKCAWMCTKDTHPAFNYTHILYPIHPDSSQQSLVVLQGLWSSCAQPTLVLQDPDKSEKHGLTCVMIMEELFHLAEKVCICWLCHMCV